MQWMYCKVETLTAPLIGNLGTQATDRAMAYLDTAGFLEYFSSSGEPDGNLKKISRHWCAF